MNELLIGCIGLFLLLALFLTGIELAFAMTFIGFAGFAFLPIAIGNILAGIVGGKLLTYFGDVLHRPALMWWVVTGIGFVGVILMIVYDRIFQPGQSSTQAESA